LDCSASPSLPSPSENPAWTDAENKTPLSALSKKSAVSYFRPLLDFLLSGRFSAVSLSPPSSFVITSPSILLLYHIFFEIGIAQQFPLKKRPLQLG
jgi:hypothetical protein